jgi:hypothetical protein
LHRNDHASGISKAHRIGRARRTLQRAQLEALAELARCLARVEPSPLRLLGVNRHLRGRLMKALSHAGASGAAADLLGVLAAATAAREAAEGVESAAGGWWAGLLVRVAGRGACTETSSRRRWLVH